MKIEVYPMHCALKCGAKTRTGLPCKSPAIHGKARCRMHGGNSTGRPKNNGRYSQIVLAEKQKWREIFRELKSLSAEIDKMVSR